MYYKSGSFLRTIGLIEDDTYDSDNQKYVITYCCDRKSFRKLKKGMEVGIIYHLVDVPDQVDVVILNDQLNKIFPIPKRRKKEYYTGSITTESIPSISCVNLNKEPRLMTEKEIDIVKEKGFSVQRISIQKKTMLFLFLFLFISINIFVILLFAMKEYFTMTILCIVGNLSLVLFYKWIKSRNIKTIEYDNKIESCYITETILYKNIFDRNSPEFKVIEYFDGGFNINTYKGTGFPNLKSGVKLLKLETGNDICFYYVDKLNFQKCLVIKV